MLLLHIGRTNIVRLPQNGGKYHYCGSVISGSLLLPTEGKKPRCFFRCFPFIFPLLFLQFDCCFLVSFSFPIPTKKKILYWKLSASYSPLAVTVIYVTSNILDYGNEQLPLVFNVIWAHFTECQTRKEKWNFSSPLEALLGICLVYLEIHYGFA